MSAWVEPIASFVLLTAVAVPLGEVIAWVVRDDAPLGPLRVVLRFIGVDATKEMDWRTYARSVLALTLLSLGFVYAVQRLQGSLPLNPANFGPVSPGVAFNTAVSFVSNTNWQAYAGEKTMSHLTQMLALTSQNFISAAVGGAVLLAVIRGFTRANANSIGNFWRDLVKMLALLLPLATVLALALVATGVPQTLQATAALPQVEKSELVTVPVGPVASQVAIKQLGTNGGGYYGTNATHPLENPSPASNTLAWLALLVIPGALCFTFGRLVGDRRQGIALYAAMSIILIAATAVGLYGELDGVPALHAMGVDTSVGHLEGKEARFGVVSSVLWSTATTAASNGAVNAMHDSLTPLGGLAPMWLMQIGEVAFGGVGSGLYGMLLYAIFAVFIAGLMVGRTPEYLGKKIEAQDVKMAALGILIPSALTLLLTAVAAASARGVEALGNPGAHGFSEILYAMTSASNNNGSAFAGLDASRLLYLLSTGGAMLVGRFGVLIPVLAIAGSLAAKRRVPETAGTLPTHTPLFVVLLVMVVFLLGALTFLPALALGPIVEQLHMHGGLR